MQCLCHTIKHGRNFRVAQLVCGRTFHIVPELVAVIGSHCHLVTPTALLVTSNTLQLLCDIVGRHKTLRLSPRHVTLCINATLGLLQAHLPCAVGTVPALVGMAHSPPKSACITTFHGACALLAQVALQRTPQCKGTQTSMASCLRHLLLGLAVHNLEADCAKRLARLIEAILNEAKAPFKKFAVYFLSDYLQLFLQRPIPKDVAHSLSEGIYMMLDILDDGDRHQLYNSLSNVGREAFKQLHSNYERDFKFRGTV